MASELEDLSVWADDLQRRGDPWGELVATSLAAAASEDPEHRRELESWVFELRREVVKPIVGPLLEGYPGIQLGWEHEVLVGLRVIGYQEGAPIDEMLHRLAALLMLPAARFLWLLQVDLGSASHLVPRLLLDPAIVARPRVLILGYPPQYVGPSDWLVADYVETGPEIAEPTRGLLSLIVDQTRVVLPWANDEGAFTRLDARIRANPRQLAAHDRILLGRALWDRNLAIRMGALDWLTLLGIEAAPFVPDLLLTEGKHEPAWHERATEVLAALARQPEVVAHVGENFHVLQVGALRWLRMADTLDDRILVRIAGMARDRRWPRYIQWVNTELGATYRQFRPRAEPALPPPPPPRPRNALQRLRGWLNR